MNHFSGTEAGTWSTTIKSRLFESAEIKNRTAKECIDDILHAAETLVEAFRNGGKVLMCGNGGSAADCQHFATELVCQLAKGAQRPALPALALTTDSSLITAYSNDYEFQGIFARQVEALGQAGDVLIAISTSGNSANVLLAVEAAKAKQLRTIALTGETGRLGAMADICIQIPSDNTQYIQEAHIAVEHILCELIETSLFSSEVLEGTETFN